MYRDINIYKCINKCIKIIPQILSLLKCCSNSFAMPAMQTSFCHKTICLFVWHTWIQKTLLVKGIKFLPLLGTHGHWAVVKLSLPVFYDLGLSWLGLEYPIFSMQRKGSNRLRHSKRKLIGEWYFYMNQYTLAAYIWKIAFMYHEQYQLNT